MIADNHDIDTVVEFFIHDIDAHRVPDEIHQIVAKWAEALDDMSNNEYYNLV